LCARRGVQTFDVVVVAKSAVGKVPLVACMWVDEGALADRDFTAQPSILPTRVNDLHMMKG